MGFFKKVSKGISKAVSNAGKSLADIPGSIQAAPQKLATETRNAANSVGRTGAAVVGAAGQILGSVTQVARDNPELLAAAAKYMGGDLGNALGGLFSPTGETAPGYAGAAAAPAEEPAGVPLWVWIAGGAAALLGLVLFLRRKAA